MVAVGANIDTANSSVSRREFLYYIWGASITLYAGQFGGLMIWFLIPRFRAGEFGGQFTLSLDEIPDINAEPKNFSDGLFWLVNLDSSNLMYDLLWHLMKVVKLSKEWRLFIRSVRI